MNKTLGQIAYEAYCAHTGWKSLITGLPILPWQDVAPKIKDAWDAAADAVKDEVNERNSLVGQQDPSE